MSDNKESPKKKCSKWLDVFGREIDLPSWTSMLKACAVCVIVLFFIYLIRLIVGESGAVDLLTSLLWPVATVFIAMIFKEPIEGFAARMTEITAPGFSARAHSEDAALSALSIDNDENGETDSENEVTDSENEVTDSEVIEVTSGDGEYCTDSVHNEEIKREGNEKPASKLNEDIQESQSSFEGYKDSVNKKNARDYNELRSRLRALGLQRSRAQVVRSEREKLNLRRSVASFQNELLVSRWNKLVSVVDDLYTEYFHDKNNLNDFQKMKRLLIKGVITNEQYVTFKKLFEAEELFNGFLSVNVANNYLYTIDRLQDSLLKVIKIK
ncbi:hypothetical protein SAMN04487958_114103 [Vreelandella subterranea]|uniref:Uncharacterized protein n=1 Tax=Vreelandella subterranea TaxID=416874 RepID=A0A1H9WGK5_9GAMM|nr:hypothetical protein [Halomonas subterranea]SES32889.1 hypothetical protein SAMN04487958_114103 [Halomonas subterranea]